MVELVLLLLGVAVLIFTVPHEIVKWWLWSKQHTNELRSLSEKEWWTTRELESPCSVAGHVLTLDGRACEWCEDVYTLPAHWDEDEPHGYVFFETTKGNVLIKGSDPRMLNLVPEEPRYPGTHFSRNTVNGVVVVDASVAGEKYAHDLPDPAIVLPVKQLT